MNGALAGMGCRVGPAARDYRSTVPGLHGALGMLATGALPRYRELPLVFQRRRVKLARVRGGYGSGGLLLPAHRGVFFVDGHEVPRLPNAVLTNGLAANARCFPRAWRVRDRGLTKPEVFDYNESNDAMKHPGKLRNRTLVFEEPLKSHGVVAFR